METKQHTINKQHILNKHRGSLKGNEKKCIELSENKNAEYQSLWDTAKALRGKFIALSRYIREEEKSQIILLSFHLKNLQKRRVKLTQTKQKEGNNKEQTSMTLIRKRQ